ncbi:MAG: autotransporter outer membrane beta-barrel domain-containing protein, partial [Pseudomonadales bacterium]
REALEGDLGGVAGIVAEAPSLGAVRDVVAQLLPALSRHRALRQRHGQRPGPAAGMPQPRAGAAPRLASAFGYAAALDSGESAPRTTLWVQAAWDDAEQDPRDGIDGFDSEARGALVGFERELTPALVAGVAVGLSEAEVVTSGRGRDDTDSQDLQGYLRWQAGAHRWSARVAVRRNDTDRVRLITFVRDGALREVRLRADIDSDERQLAVGWQWSPALPGGWYLTPSVQLSHLRLATDDYLESGGGALGLLVTTDDERQWLGNAGVAFGRFGGAGAWGWSTGAFVSFERLLRGDEVETTSTFAGTRFAFTSRAAQLEDTAVMAGIDLGLVHAGGFGAHLGLARTWQDDYRHRALMLGVEFSF